MFCTLCGNQITAGVQFCPRCGTQVMNTAPTYGAPPAQYPGYSTPPQYPPVAAPPRVKPHIQTLGILWCVYIALRLLGSVWLYIILRSPLFHIFDQMPDTDPQAALALAAFHHFMTQVMSIVLGASLAFLTFYAVAVYGLLTRKSWGRVVMIIAAIPALLGIPLGTALGIYTLWVLASSNSKPEYEALVVQG